MKLLFALTFLALGSIACSGSESNAGSPESAGDDGALEIAVVNYPLKYFAERIGGEHVTVAFPAPADVDPAFWEPDAEAIGGYQGADLILLNGAAYAKWAEHATLPTSRLVDTSASFEDRLISIESSVTHAHGPDGEHSHGNTAFTTWLDPTLALEQAHAILAAFERARPEGSESFREGFAGLERDLFELDARLGSIVARAPGRALVASHPVYQYLERRYALELKSVHWEPDQAPSEEMWRELEELLSVHPARSMLWEGEPLDETKARLETLGVRCIVFAPASNRPPRGDFLDVMNGNADELARAFRP